MKKGSVLFLVICMLLTSKVYTQGYADYMQHHWYGYYTESSDLFEGDSYTMYYEVYDVYFDNTYNTFSATMYSSININGISYTTTFKITGSLTTDYAVSIIYNYTISADQLPNEMYWIYDNLYGTLYGDQDHPGEYLIRGYKPNTSGTFEISTYK